MHVRDGSGSGGIVSQMKASIELKSKAKAGAGNPSSAAVPNSTKQKINVRERERVCFGTACIIAQMQQQADWYIL